MDEYNRLQALLFVAHRLSLISKATFVGALSFFINRIFCDRLASLEGARITQY